MADNKKYYYMRLKENFFESDELLLLEAMPEGYIYSNILLKLYLRSLKNNGKLMFNDRIPYNAQMIATITRQQVGTVEKALRIFQDMGLIEVLENGAIYMLDIQQFIGKSSTEADRVRAYRIEVEAQKLITGHTTVQNPYKCTPEIEIELEKDIEIKIKKEKEIEKKEDSTSEPQDPPIITLLLNTKEEYQIYQIDIEAWHDLYPAVDIMTELRKMKGWLIANPSKRKTKKGILRFINSWLAKEQDRPHYNKPSNPIDPFENFSHADKEPAATEITETEYNGLIDDINQLLKGG